mgnify:FL=1
MTIARLDTAVSDLEADLARYIMIPALREHILSLIRISRELEQSVEHARTVVSDLTLR